MTTGKVGILERKKLWGVHLESVYHCSTVLIEESIKNLVIITDWKAAIL